MRRYFARGSSLRAVRNGPSYFAVTREGDEGPIIEAFEKRGRLGLPGW